MKIEAKDLFQANKDCLSLKEIIEYLDERNYEERRKQEEYHERYNEGSIFLRNEIKIQDETKDRLQIFYKEFQRAIIMTDEYIVHQPSWIIVVNGYNNKVWIKGEVTCYFSAEEKSLSDPFIPGIPCKKKVKRIYNGILECPYNEFTLNKLESMLKECVKNLKYVRDEVRYDEIEADPTIIDIPVIMYG